MTSLSFYDFIKNLENNNIFMIIGNGSKNQFRNIITIKSIINNISNQIPLNSNILYFGDYPDKANPDIGYVFYLLHQKRKDLNICMIQIMEAKKWGVPDFVKSVYWHNVYSSRCKYGGLINNEPCSNTLKWVNIHKKLDITKVFILGGGKITLDEFKLIKKYNINYEYYLIERKYLGDGTTKINNKHSKKDKYGITFGKIK
jgi:hypothetical protein